MQDRSLFYVLTLGPQWPVTTETKIASASGDGDTLATWATTDGRLKMVASQSGSDPVVTLSPVVRLIDPVATPLIISVQLRANVIELHLNGSLVSANGPDISLSGGPPPRAPTVDRDGLALAREKRRSQRRDYKRAGQLSEDLIGRTWADLAKTCRLLRADLDHLRRGDSDRIVPVSVYLRTLIDRRQGNHLLQYCATIADAELPVWTHPPLPENAWTPANLPHELTLWHFASFGAGQHGVLSHCIDLDAWLLLNAGKFANKPLDNGQVLADITDKIGAHVSRGERPTVDALQATEYGCLSGVAHVLLDVGDGVVVLTERLLAAQSAKVVGV